MNFLNIKKYLPLLASVTVGLVLGVLISNLLLQENKQKEEGNLDKENLITSFHSAVKKASPAVVNIYSEMLVNKRNRNLFFSDRFTSIFGKNNTRVQSSLGSGVIFSSDGYILTNQHVIGDVSIGIIVELSDGRKKEAKKIEAAITKEVSIAVAAFANQQGGRLFIGVDDDGVVTGLKRDLKLYKNWDEYTRAIIDSIEEFTKNRAHASSIRLKEEENQEYLVLDVPISIHEPIFIHDNKKEEFYVRDATAKSQKFEATDMMRYCNKRFPDWKV